MASAKRKMPKVVPEYKEQARISILDAAAAEFSEKGYRKTTMDDIAKRIGVSKGALYQYFRSKEQLLGALGERLVRIVAEEIESSLKEGRQLREVSEEAFDSVSRLAQRIYPNLVVELLYEAPNSKELQAIVRKYTDEAAMKVAGFLDERKRTGEIRQDANTKAIAHGIMILQRGQLIQLSLGAPKSQVRQAWNETMRAILAGLK